jgi:hypothetical protein
MNDVIAISFCRSAAFTCADLQPTQFFEGLKERGAASRIFCLDCFPCVNGFPDDN